MKRVLTRLIRLGKEQRAAKERRSVPDCLLRDMGITRDQIDAYVRDELSPREVRRAPTARAMRFSGARHGSGVRCCAA